MARTFSLPSQTGNAGKYLKTDGTNVLWDTPAGGGMAIGGAVTGGTAFDVLFVGAGGLLAQSNNFQFNLNSLNELNVTGQYWNNGFFFGMQDVANGNAFIGLGTTNNLGVSSNNAFFGINAGNQHTTGASNSYFGTSAGYFGQANTRNSAFGYSALLNNTANNNTAFGYSNSSANVGGTRNTSFGSDAQVGVSGNDNTTIGYLSGSGLGTGIQNTFVGSQVGQAVGAGNNNTIIGALGNAAVAGTTAGIGLGAGVVVDSNEFVVGSSIALISNVYIGQGKTSAAPSTSVFITGTGAITSANTAGSSLRFRAGRGTGNSTGMEISFATPDPTVSGSTQQNWSDNLTLGSTNKSAFFYGRLLETEGNNVTAANTITLGDGNFFTINGNTTINNIVATNWNSAGANVGGAQVTLLFTGTPTVNHNTAGAGARIFLAGSIPLSAAANTILGLIWDGTQWQETFRKVA